MMDRLTTDNPKGNFDTMMNFAYAKDGNVVLRYGARKCDIDLCEYMETVADCQFTGMEAEDYMEGACLECGSDCPFGILYTTATQAAELRARLKVFEDIEDKKQTFFKKPVVQQLRGWDSEFPVEMSCPNCFQPIIIIEAWKKLNYKPRFCYECGQALDWSEYD